jgi:phosphoglycerate-specific signal transduction histidine kinase
MQWFRDLQIGRKLGLAFIAITLLALILGLFAMYELRNSQALVRNITTESMPA